MEKKKFPVKAEINVDLTQQDIDDIMVAALEGGIDYWCFKADRTSQPENRPWLHRRCTPA